MNPSARPMPHLLRRIVRRKWFSHCYGVRFLAMNIAGNHKRWACLALCLLLLGATTTAQQPSGATQPQPAPLGGQLVLEKFHSAALEHSLLGDSADRSFYVYLPPSYSRGEHRYPVLYMLHGYLGDHRWSIRVSRIV